MKIIHTSDWHLGQIFYRFDREDEHRHFFDQLITIMREHRPDALLVSGDVFHSAAPSIAAQRLFVDGVIALHDASPDTMIIITAGNHDSGSRLEAERQLWARLGVHVIGSCQRREDGTFDPMQFVIDVHGKGYVLAVPFFNQANYPMAAAETPRDERQRQFFALMLKQVVDSHRPVVMMAHLAVQGCDITGHEDVPVGGMLTEPLDQLGIGYDYLALGHIHKPQSIDQRVRYSGSPIPVSFSEDYDHYVNLVEMQVHGDMPQVTQIHIAQKRKVKTIPPEGASLAQALEALEALDANDNSYVRVLIDQDEMLAPDAEDRARKIAEAKSCLFCELRRKPKNIKRQATDSPVIVDVNDFTKIEPLEIAKQSYLRKIGAEMPTDLIDMMKQAINLANG